MLNLLIRAVMQISNTSAAAAACADGAAISGQLADALLQINRNQIAQQHSTQQLLLACCQCMCVNNNRDRSRNALVAAAGGNDNGQLTAVHACVTACRCTCTCARTQAVRVTTQQNLADACAIIMVQAFLRNSHVIFNLALQQMLHIIQRHMACCVQHILNAPQALSLFLFRHDRLRENRCTVLLNRGHIRMVCADGNLSILAVSCQKYADVENIRLLGNVNLDFAGLCQLLQRNLFLSRNISQHLQLTLRMCCHNACCARNLDTLHMVSVRHNNAFYVFDNIAANPDFDFLRLSTQLLTANCCTVSNRNRFGTTHGRDKLLCQRLLIDSIIFLHLICPPFPLHM